MASQELPTGLRLGSYELLTRIGEGGMGTVYAAIHVGLGKRVAIKTLRSAFEEDAGVLTRFLREGKAAAAVRHPNVVDIDDVGVHDGVPYLVMELLEGESLQAMLARRQRLSPQETADIVVPVLSAMAASHRAGVVHRDLKPDNIFLARGAGGLPVPKVLDFGISKLLETQSFRLTGEKTMLGTPYYMAPEQASSARDVDARSDLYTIGVILYHAVTGRVPFAGSSLAQVLSQILHARPVPLTEWVPDVPAAFEAIVLRAMEKDPAARYQDAQSFGRALLPFASERIVLTYRAELESAAEGGMSVALHEQVAAANTTLSSAVRSLPAQQADASKSVFKVAAALAALALVGAALTLWPRSETTVSPVQQPQASGTQPLATPPDELQKTPLPAAAPSGATLPGAPPPGSLNDGTQPPAASSSGATSPSTQPSEASTSQGSAQSTKLTADPDAQTSADSRSQPSATDARRIGKDRAKPVGAPARPRAKTPARTSSTPAQAATPRPPSEQDIWGNRK